MIMIQCSCEGNSEYQMQRLNLFDRIFKLFLFSLFFMLPVTMRTSVVASFGQLVGYVVIVVGVLYLFRSGKRCLPKLLIALVGIVLLWQMISLFNSIIYHSAFGLVGGEDTFRAILGPSYFLIYDVFFLLFFVFIARKASNVKQDIIDVFETVLNVEIIVGYLQLFMMKGVPGFLALYDFINIGQIFMPSDIIIEMQRVPMTGSEPAAMGTLLCILLFPYLLSFIPNNMIKRKYRFIKLVLCGLLCFFTFSSTLYVMGASLVGMYLLRGTLYKPQRRKIVTMLISGGLVVLWLLLSFSVSYSLRREGSYTSSFQYVFVDKLFDFNNQSTAHRWSTTVNDLRIIKDYPVLGVGNGNQGFLYAANIPNYMQGNEKTRAMMQGDFGVVNGGAFLFAILSGYGILGILPLVWWGWVYFHYVRSKNIMPQIQTWLFLTTLPILIMLLTSSMDLSVLFVLSMPFWAVQDEKTNSILSQ